MAANKACSRQVGLGAFLELVSGFEFFPAPEPSLGPPTYG